MLLPLTARHLTRPLLALSILIALAMSPAAPVLAKKSAKADEATGVGIYYPPVTSGHKPKTGFKAMEGAGPTQRQLFVDQLNIMTAGPERAIPIIMQAVGAQKTTLVIMNIEPIEYFTPYVAKALLARMTSIARFQPDITDMGLSDTFDVYAMGIVLGFERIIVTDGRKFSHEAVLE